MPTGPDNPDSGGSTELGGSSGEPATPVTATPVAPSAVAAVRRPVDGSAIGGVTNTRAVDLAGNAAPGATVRVYDHGTLVATTTADETGAWSTTATGLSDGPHSFTTTVTDTSGNTSDTSSTRDLTVDATAPTASAVAEVRSTDGAAVATATRAQSVNLSGTAEAGATVRVFDNGTEVAQTTADANGAWSVTATNLADGTHDFTTTVTDAAGNESTASAARRVAVDTAAPTAPAVAEVRSTDGAAVATATRAQSVSLSGTAEAGATVRVFDNGTEVAQTTADANGAWSVTATNLADGTHDFTTTVTDAAGNESAASAASRLAVDTAAPVAAPVAEVKRAADGASVDALTNAKAVTLRGTAEPGAVVKVYDRGAEVASTTADANGAWSVTASNLADGSHSFTTTVVDEAGNEGAVSAARDVTVDATAPVAAPVAEVKRADDGASVAAATNTKIVVLRGTAEPGAVVKVSDGGAVVATTTADASGAWSVTATNLAEGAHNFTTTVTDAAGNESGASAARAVTVDTVAPVASAVSAVKRADGTAVGSITNTKAVTLSGAAEAGATVTVLDGTKAVGTATADATGAWSVTASNLAEGAHNFTTTVTEVAGNASAPSAVRAVTVDTIAPAATAAPKFSPDSGPVGDGTINAKNIVLSGTAEAGATVKVLDGTKVVGTATADASGAWSLNADNLANGTHNFTTTVTDAAGNTSGASAALNVTVDARPVITSNGGGGTATIKVFEMVKPVTKVVGTDAQPGALSYSIVGGADATKFTIDATTGALAFIAAPDYENPTDAGHNNVYDVVVQVTDSDGDFTTQAIAVNVVNLSPEPVYSHGGPTTFLSTPEREVFYGTGAVDTVSYEAAKAGITASLANPLINKGEAGGDFYFSVENLTGSSFADKLVGDARANVLDGGPGGDRLEGGLGSDTASYARATAGVTADLTKSANNTGEAAGDTYLSIENLTGSKFADRLVGDQNANVLSGSDGADTLIANAGNDRLIGGLGPDILNGGAGKDVYVLLSAKDGVATFQGFVVKDDQIEVSASGFPGLVAGQKLVDGVTFISGASPLAPTTKATFLYDTKTQDLYFDDDGSGVHGAQKIVHFDTPVTLHANDFDIVA